MLQKCFEAHSPPDLSLVVCDDGTLYKDFLLRLCTVSGEESKENRNRGTSSEMVESAALVMHTSNSEETKCSGGGSILSPSSPSSVDYTSFPTDSPLPNNPDMSIITTTSSPTASSITSNDIVSTSAIDLSTSTAMTPSSMQSPSLILHSISADFTLSEDANSDGKMEFDSTTTTATPSSVSAPYTLLDESVSSLPDSSPPLTPTPFPSAAVHSSLPTAVPPSPSLSSPDSIPYESLATNDVVGTADAPTTTPNTCVTPSGAAVTSDVAAEALAPAASANSNVPIDQPADNPEVIDTPAAEVAAEDVAEAKTPTHVSPSLTVNATETMAASSSPTATAASAPLMPLDASSSSFADEPAHSPSTPAMFEPSTPTPTSLAVSSSSFRGDSKGDSACTFPPSQVIEGWRPVMILVPLRLGMRNLNPLYVDSLLRLFQFPQALGIIGMWNIKIDSSDVEKDLDREENGKKGFCFRWEAVVVALFHWSLLVLCFVCFVVLLM